MLAPWGAAPALYSPFHHQSAQLMPSWPSAEHATSVVRPKIARASYPPKRVESLTHVPAQWFSAIAIGETRRKTAVKPPCFALLWASGAPESSHSHHVALGTRPRYSLASAKKKGAPPAVRPEDAPSRCVPWLPVALRNRAPPPATSRRPCSGNSGGCSRRRPPSCGCSPRRPSGG